MTTRLITLQVGLRGWGLALLGTVWILIGLGVAVGASNPPDDASLWHVIIPRWARATMWILPGVAAFVGARWCRWSDRALGLLTIMPTVRLTSYLAAWVAYLVPGAPEGSRWGWYSASFYVVMLALVLFVTCIPSRQGRNRSRALLQQRLEGRVDD